MALVEDITGFLRLKGGKEFQRDYDKRIDGIRKSVFNLNNALLGGGALLFFNKLGEAADRSDIATRKLSATSRLTGASLAEMSAIADEAQERFSLNEKQASEFTIALTKLGQKSGDVSKTSTALERLLDLAAAQGLNAEQALVAIDQAILGIDEGTDKLFQKNPSAIYAEYAAQIGTTAGKLDDQQKAQALLNAVLESGLKVQGEYSEFLQSAQGDQARFASSAEQAAAKFGEFVQLIRGPILRGFTTVLDFLTKAPPEIRNLVAAGGGMILFLKLFAGAIQALFVSIGPVGWLIAGISVLATLFLGLQAATGKAADEMAKFNAEIKTADLASSEQKLAELRGEMEKLNKEMAEQEALRIEGPDQFDLSPQAEELRRFQQQQKISDEFDEQSLDNQKRRLQEKIDAVQEHIDKLKSATEQVVEVQQEQLADEEEIMRHRNKIGEVSNQEYAEFLRQRRDMLTRWTPEWIELNEQLLSVEKKIRQDRANAQKAAQTEQERINQITLAQAEETNQEVQRILTEGEAIMRERVLALTDLVFVLSENIVGGLANAFRKGEEGLKGAMKGILLTLLRFVRNEFLLAKASALIEGIINPFIALRKAGPLLAAAGAISALEGQIASFADGGIVVKPTLAVLGDSRRGPEIVAPEEDFLQVAERLLEGEFGRSTTINDRQVVQYNFNTPLQDRRTARRLAEVQEQERRRQAKRQRRALNEAF